MTIMMELAGKVFKATIINTIKYVLGYKGKYIQN